MGLTMFSTMGLYRSDERFKAYVEKYSRQYGILISEALKHSVVEEAAKYYMQNPKTDYVSVSGLKAGCGAAESGGDCK